MSERHDSFKVVLPEELGDGSGYHGMSCKGAGHCFSLSGTCDRDASQGSEHAVLLIGRAARRARCQILARFGVKLASDVASHRAAKAALAMHRFPSLGRAAEFQSSIPARWYSCQPQQEKEKESSFSSGQVDVPCAVSRIFLIPEMPLGVRLPTKLARTLRTQGFI